MIEVRRTADEARPLLVRRDPTDGAEAFERCLDVVVRGGHTHVTVDLGEAPADADLLSVLHRNGRLLLEAGGRLEVVRPSSDLRRLLNMTLLSRTIAVRAARETADSDDAPTAPATPGRAG